ncbi:MAG: hypothetical protein AAF798_19935, partial [Bacteroidota bacterium]
IEFIKKNNISEIEHIFLSHPHDDHFSGMLDLLTYCEANKVKINYFLHTCVTTPDYLMSAVKSRISEELLFKIFSYISVKASQGSMNTGYFIADIPMSKFSLSPSLRLEIMSPSFAEEQKYTGNAMPKYIEEGESNKAKANYLSSVFEISHASNNWFVILTADADNSTFTRMKKHKTHETRKLILAQMPHHGARANFNQSFWYSRIANNKGVYFVASVGNNGYGHPAKKNIDFVKRHKGKAFFTKKMSMDVSSKTSHLDSFSAITVQPNLINHCFEIDESGNITQSTFKL